MTSFILPLSIVLTTSSFNQKECSPVPPIPPYYYPNLEYFMPPPPIPLYLPPPPYRYFLPPSLDKQEVEQQLV